MLVIEIDGIPQENKTEEDSKRQKELEQLGLSFLRFNALDVVNNIEGVLEIIRNWLREHEIPTPSPSQEGN